MADNEMVKNADIDQFQCVYQPCGDQPIGLTGFGIPGRVIMSQHHCRSIMVHGGAQDFPWMNFRMADTAGEQRLMRQ